MGSPRVRWRLASYGRSRLGHAALPRPPSGDHVVKTATEPTSSYDGLMKLAAVFAAVTLSLYLFRCWLGGAAREAEARRGGAPGAPRPAVAPSRSSIRMSASAAARASAPVPRGRSSASSAAWRRCSTPSKCIGHGKCAAECPVDAIKLVFGSARARRRAARRSTSHFETSRPGVHIVGELAGMGLIKNALIQGLQVAARLRDTIDSPAPRRARRCRRRHRRRRAGRASRPPSGCRAAGLSFALLEQDTRGRHGRPLPAPEAGDDREPSSCPTTGQLRPPLISQGGSARRVQQVIAKARHRRVHERTKVTGHRRRPTDDFLVDHRHGRDARRAGWCSRSAGAAPRGSWACRARSSPKVAYRLVDPRAVRGQARAGGGRRRLGARGGDRARRGEPTPRSRSPTAAGVRPLPAAQQATMDAQPRRGRIRACMSTEVAAVEPERGPRSRTAGRRADVPNDFVIACLGGELPAEFLKSIGVSIRRHSGDKAMANPALARGASARPRAAAGAIALASSSARWWPGLAAVGGQYYLLPAPAALQVPRPRAAEAVRANGGMASASWRRCSCS